MPIYPHSCSKCGEKHEFFLKMSEEKPTVCPSCGCDGCLIRDFSGIGVTMDASKAKTIGDLANKNTEKAVKEGTLPKSALEFDSKKAERKKQHSKMREIAEMTPTQKRNYIMTGKKNA